MRNWFKSTWYNVKNDDANATSSRMIKKKDCFGSNLRIFQYAHSNTKWQWLEIHEKIFEKEIACLNTHPVRQDKCSKYFRSKTVTLVKNDIAEINDEFKTLGEQSNVVGQIQML